ncbi:hypothetical protein C0J52_22419 [Blattella germanica]|nr:hypothetical protein C0J52_22419 [Blattella germanica]
MTNRAVNLLVRTGGWLILILILQLGVADYEIAFTLHERENVKIWANEIGRELWELGQVVTRSNEMKARYQKLNVRVQEKDGETLLMEIAENVQNMLDRKMDAVKCIMLAAEEAAEFYNSSDVPENFTFYSSKNSFIEGEPAQSRYMNNKTYAPMYLTPDSHFYDIPVNLSYTEPVLDTIKWSEALDDVFVHNYHSDPALSLQYFGSSYGLMRSYPAMKWRGDPDLFDCRNRYWYIEAATCTKDLVILMDNSGSMTGYRNTIARLTVSNILDTLNNNDWVNVFNYSDTTDEAVPCFKDMLVQATIENVNTLKEHVEKIKPEGHANLTYAFTRAFQLLEKYREIRGCSNSSEGIQCTQAIMLVTDGVAGNITEVFEEWNWQENSTYMPVRVFTFLVGQEVTKVQEIQLMACLNKAAVLKDPTLAAWLFDVKKTTDHKKRLSKHARNRDFSQGKEDHIYIRIPGKSEDDEDPALQEYRIMISVSIPAFDRKMNSLVGNDTRLANLLGVAGTDMPIKDMDKLTHNYKSGVNGYAFIVTNNGYVVWHPDLRPVFRGVLKKNYNSVDLTEIELLDDGSHSRELSPEIVELRNAMVNHTEGKILGLRMKFHYDDLRRVAVEYKDFFWTPLKGTPFTLGLAIPEGYGRYYVNPGDEVQQSRHKKIPIISYLKGSPWRIHPEWIYCKYHFTQFHPFETPEEELVHFLHKMGSSDWVWEEQYEKKEESEEELGNFLEEDSMVFFVENGTEQIDCNKRIIEEDEYYCDRGLVQLFTFDARITDPFFRKQALKFRNEMEEELINTYNITLKFVATQSGLTRWLKYREDTVPPPAPMPKKEEKEIKLDEGDEDGVDVEDDNEEEDEDEEEEEPESTANYLLQGFRDDAQVRVSHAIFPRDGGMQAPASVIGYQFMHSAFISRFMEITSKTTCQHCHECASEELDCFVLDNNGYVVLSEDHNSTGRFFGEVEGAVMDALRSGNSVYRKVTMYDYQGLCFDEERRITGDASILLTLKMMVQWMFGQVLWLLFESNLGHLWYGTNVQAMPDIVEVYDEEYEVLTEEEEEEEEDLGPKQRIEIIQIPRPCDQRTSLYLLQDEEPHLVERIPYTNLVLVVIKSMFQSCFKKVISAPIEIQYNGTEHPCQKLLLNNLPRRRLSGCFAENDLEPEVKLCGDCNRIETSVTMFILSWFVVFLGRYLHQ